MKKHTDWIKEMSWTEFRDRKATCDTVIIPGGAIEVYGPHLPLGTDSLVSWKMCELLAERTGAMIGPTIEAGESDVLFNFPGTVRIRPHTYELVMRDIIESMIKWGFKNFLFLNMHAGNVPIITQLCREYQRSAGIKCAQIDWWRFTQPNTKDICEYSGWMAHGHASECGTSLMLYLWPELVDETKFDCVKLDPKFSRYPDIITYDPFENKTSSGILGDATAASREKGEKIVNACLDRMEQFMKEYFTE